MKKILVASLALLLGGAAAVQAATITNPWSGTAGDRANIMGFAFQADAGQFPASVDPAGALTDTIQLTKVSLVRPASPNPASPVTPSFGEGPRQTTDSLTPIYLDVYTAVDADTDTFSGFLGSSTNGVAWEDTTELAPYAFEFAGLTLNKGTKYWFVFSEDNVDGEFSNFRLQVNTSGNDATAGAGQGYLVGDTFQILDQGGNVRDWAAAFTAEFTAIPEPSCLALVLGGVALAGLRRRAAR